MRKIAKSKIKLYYNGLSQKWETAEYTYDPTAVPANFEKVLSSLFTAGGATNVVTVLQFDKDLATEEGKLNYHKNADCELATKMTIGGVAAGSANLGLNIGVSSGYAGTRGLNTLEIWFQSYKTPIKHGTCLHIPAGTAFSESVILGEVTLYYSFYTNAWQTEEPAPYIGATGDFYTEDAGSIRYTGSNGHNGLRFTTYYDKTTFDTMVATYGEENIELGTYILPKDYLTLSGKATLSEYIAAYASYNTNQEYYMVVNTYNQDQGGIGFVNGKTAEDGEDYFYYGSITGILEKNYAREFIGVGYLKLTVDGETYTYLTHEGEWSRSVYYVAKEAYMDTKNVDDSLVPGLTPYLDKVVAITTDGNATSGYVNDIDAIKAARPNYAYTPAANYTVTANKETGVIGFTSNSGVYSLVVNGGVAGTVEAGVTKYTDYYALERTLVDDSEKANALNFGFAEPNRDLYASGNDGFNSMFNGETNQYSTASNIAKVTAEFDGNSARIWFQTADLCWSSSDGDTLVLNEACLTELKSVIRDFRAQGVTNISLMSGVANTKTTKNWYIGGTWYNTADASNEINNNGKTADGMVLGLVVLPDEQDYKDFLALQKEYFTQLALAVGDTVTAIEVLNEMEGSNNYRYCYENKFPTDNPTYSKMPSMTNIAQAAMDICKAATDGVKAAGKNIKIAMPALMTVSELTVSGNVTRYASKAFLEAEYDYIESVGGDPDDYFQIINMHPYIILSSATSTTNYLYYENDGLTVQTPTQMQERWLTYMDEMREVFVANGDAEKPVWITEFGLSDYNGDCAAESIGTSKWSDYKNNRLLRKAQVYQAIYDAMKRLPWLDTVLLFRLGDYEHADHNLNICGEATYGVIDTSGNLKDFGKYLYAIVNGVNVFSDTLANGYKSLKSLDSLGAINGKTVSQLESNVNGIY